MKTENKAQNTMTHNRRTILFNG